MELVLDSDERAAVRAAAKATRLVAQWQRYQAVLLLSSGQTPARVAEALDVCPASVYNWANAWRGGGLAGLALVARRGGQRRRFDAVGEAWLEALMRTDARDKGHVSSGWTVPLLRCEARQAGYAVGERTLRRTLHRLGWRWRGGRFVLARTIPAFEGKPAAQVFGAQQAS